MKNYAFDANPLIVLGGLVEKRSQIRADKRHGRTGSATRGFEGGQNASLSLPQTSEYSVR